MAARLTGRALWPFRRARRLASNKQSQVAELGFWVDVWDAVLREGGLWGPNTLELSGSPTVAPTYEGRRWQQAQAEVKRILAEAHLTDEHFFDGKTVVDIGSGPVGFPDACPAALSIGVDPLADAYTAAGLMLASPALYLSVGAERLPLVSGSIDVVTARNSLDHVREPRRVIEEACRVLKPGGTLIVNVDVDHPATVTEPHSLSVRKLRSWLAPMTLLAEHAAGTAHGCGGEPGPGRAVVFVAEKPGADS